MRFHDRHQAGKELAEALAEHIETPAVVYALPRGGVPVATEVARRFGLPLDLVIPRKIGHPLQPEYAIGAVTEEGKAVYNEKGLLGVDASWVQAKVKAEREEAARRRKLYCAGRARTSAQGRCAILVDDGVATGMTLLAAIEEIKADKPSRLIVAVPVAPYAAAQRFADLVDCVVTVHTPIDFHGSVGAYYENFLQVSDQDVLDELARLAGRSRRARRSGRS
jgi:predicted phosphoribosyltransferase